MSEWTSVHDNLPPEGVVVEVESPSGNTRQLKRLGDLWFLPDGSMYVYFTPVAWRELDVTVEELTEEESEAIFGSASLLRFGVGTHVYLTYYKRGIYPAGWKEESIQDMEMLIPYVRHLL